MNVLKWLTALTLSGLCVGLSLAGPPMPKKLPTSSLPTTVVFNRDVRPILSDNCFACHGPDKNKRQANLRLDQPNRAVVPGDILASELVQRIQATDERQMPPTDFHKRLTGEQKSLLMRWVGQGATYQKHWAYEAPVKAKVPTGVNAVDFLVRQRLTQIGLHPSPQADRRTLIRRLSFDLIGLPPTPEEVAAFVGDTSPDAYSTVVERLLANPHYGERMAQGWLDVVRFADTIGYHSDTPRNIWPYRDYVIASFNSNKRFDRFTLEQLAGDLLPDANQETRIGSAFNRLLLTTEEGGAQPRDYEARYLTDRVRAVGTVWLGQTTGCAQCHDHKFDPIKTRDFYALGAFFADIDEAIIGAREPGLLLPTPEQAAELKRRQDHAAEVEQQLKGQTTDAAKAQITEAQKQRDDYERSITHCLITVRNAKPRTVRVLPRGNFLDESGEVVQPATPTFLPRPTGGSRLDLANWLVNRDNPLTARTVMNRLWKQFYGTGLSKVLEDLGAQGEPPANPALLDWLACEFMDSGWDIKHMVRLIVSSETYKQVSTASKKLLLRDPYNREYARQSRFRLEAEEVRDNALMAAGLLSLKIGGPSVKPYQPERYWENLNFPVRDYVPDQGESQYRRGLYTWWQRSFVHPSLLAFDAPTREECAADRTRSNIPQQALVLLNDPTYVEASRALASRILTEAKGSVEQRIAWAWRQTLQRTPTAQETAVLARLYAQQRAVYQANPTTTDELLKTGFAPTPDGADRVELATWTHIARVLLNLHETITRS